MKIVKHYYTEGKIIYDAITREVEVENAQMTGEERENKRQKLKAGFAEVAALAEQYLQEHPRILNTSKKSAFEELARQALDYAKAAESDIEVDFDAGMAGIITLEANYLMANSSFPKHKQEFIPMLMNAAEEYCISAGKTGETFILQFTFPYYDEM